MLEFTSFMNVIAISHMVQLRLIMALYIRHSVANIAFNFAAFLDKLEIRIDISPAFRAS
jgi:hypothetical protein